VRSNKDFISSSWCYITILALPLCFILYIELKHVARVKKIRYKIRLTYSIIKYLIL